MNQLRPRIPAALWMLVLLPLLWSRSLEAQAPPPPSQDLRKPPAPAAEAEADFWSRVSLETAMQVDAGKYGGKTGSTFISFPVTIGYDHDGVVASVSVPYVLQRTHGNAIRVGGRIVRTSGVPQRRAKTVGGLGDVLVDGGYYLLDSKDELPYLLLEGEVKIPTADDERGLGTGSPDETIRVSSGVTFFEHLKLALDLGYQFIGQPEDILSSVSDFHNAVLYGAGVGYKFNSSNTLWAKLDGSTTVVPRTQPYDLLYVEWDHYFKNDSRLLISLGAGMTKSTPGLSFELAYLFWF